MENQNILTIKFNTLDDLAVQVADWHERLNHQCQGQCMSEKPTVKVTPGTSLELAKTKKEEKGEPVAKPTEATKAEEPDPVETSQQDTELDVAAEPVDKKAFYKEFRAWMGEDGVKAKKALAIFSKHGVTRPSSDSLTDDLITDLKSIMAEKEA